MQLKTSSIPEYGPKKGTYIISDKKLHTYANTNSFYHSHLSLNTEKEKNDDLDAEYSKLHWCTLGMRKEQNVANNC